MSACKVLALSIVSLLQSGCGSTPTKTMQAAVLTQHSVATTKVLNSAVSRALNGVKVSLASRALTQRSDVEVERMAQDSVSVPGLNGRLMGKPVVHRFLLKQQAGDCYLVYEKTGQAYLLEGVKCQVL